MFKSAFIVWKLANHSYYPGRSIFALPIRRITMSSSATRATTNSHLEELQPNQKLVIIDTDAGYDDALAILVALDKKNDAARVIAMTSVFGNTSSDQAALNLRRIVAMNYYESFSTKDETERKGTASTTTTTTTTTTTSSQMVFPKIYRGASQPIMSPQAPPSWPGHGSNGLGGWTGDDYEHSDDKSCSLEDYVPLQQEHAVNALIRLVQEHPPNTIDLVAIGPLTNIALASKLDPAFLPKLKSIHIMGGSLYAQGNASLSSEFNFWCDPEAAHIVLGQQHGSVNGDDETKIVVVPWETTVDASVSWEYYDSLTSYGTKRSKFLKEMCQHAYEKYVRHAASPTPPTKKAILHDQFQFIACDVLAVAALLYPEETITDAVEAHVDVETRGTHSRGMLAIDWYGQQHHGKDPQINIIQKMNTEVLWKIVEDMIRQP